MSTYIQLNLQNQLEKTATPDLPKRDAGDPKPLEVSKRLNRIANKAAHKAATEYRRSNSGIFSK